MKNQKYKDQFRRNSYKKNEFNKYVVNGSHFLINNFNKKKCSKDMNICRINNRCLITYRSRAVLRNFKMNRGLLRTLISFSNVPGVHKSSW
jgi:small subunit ribosomal protein S14